MRSTLERWWPELRRGLTEVLTARDPPFRPRSRSVRLLILLATAAGALLLLIALFGVIRAIRGDPGVVVVVPGGAFTSARAKTFDIAGVLGLTLLCVRYPLLAWRIGFSAVMIVPLFAAQQRVSFEVGVAILICYWVAGLRHGRAAAWAMCLLMLVPTWLWFEPNFPRRVLASVVVLVVAVALDATLASRRAGHALAAQVAQSEADEADRAVLEERTRIAREMHDVVAHHMSLIAVQAETAPYRVDDLSPEARAEFASVSATARDALTDLRRVLGVLRNHSPAERVPQPQLMDVTALVDATRRAGVSVELSMPANGSADVSHAVGLCAYRIVQEALSNAGRHAPGSGVVVTVERFSGALRLDVVNGPPVTADPEPRAAKPGHGIAGMRERVALLGGSISAEPNEVGGFAVSAVLPLKEVAE